MNVVPEHNSNTFQKLPIQPAWAYQTNLANCINMHFYFLNSHGEQNTKLNATICFLAFLIWEQYNKILFFYIDALS